MILTPRHQPADDAGGALRRFGLALARDGRFVCDERTAVVLVESLSRRAALMARSGEHSLPGDPRLLLFSLFVSLYRRHVRMAAVEDGLFDPASPADLGRADSREGGSRLERAISDLPLELRESLLLVVLERFSHIEAAQILDIPLATLHERLARGRALLAAAFSRKAAPLSRLSRPYPQRRGASYLRLVK